MLTDKQIRARIRSLTQHATNRTYADRLLDREVEENQILFFTRCQQCQKDPSKMIGLLAQQMKELKNLSFGQAVIMTFGLKGYTNYHLSGWKPIARLKRRDRK